MISARFDGVLFFLEYAFFLNIGRRTRDEYVELSWRSRLLPKVSVMLHSSLIFPEPQVRTDCKKPLYVVFIRSLSFCEGAQSHGKYYCVIERNLLFLLILDTNLRALYLRTFVF